MSTLNTIEKISNVETKAVFSKDMSKRYLLEINFHVKGKKACIIMLYPSDADEYKIDQTTQLVRNNAVLQGFSSISIVNLFCGLEIKNPKTDRVNASMIAESCSGADVIIVAYGRGNTHLEEKEKLLDVLKPFQDKLFTIVDTSGQPFSHPLSPKARLWTLKSISSAQ